MALSVIAKGAPVLAERDRLSEFSALIDQTGGRDKLCRLLQYFAKFMKWYHEEKDKNPAAAKKWASLGVSMSTTRKVLRFFRSIAILRNAFTLYRNAKSVDAQLLFDLSARFCLASYFMFDHAMYAFRLGLITDPKMEAKCSQMTEGSWVGEIVSSLCLSLLKLLELSSKDTTSQIQELRNKELRGVLRNSLDLPLALNFMGYFQDYPNGIFGLGGAITSGISLWEMWPVLFAKK
jgi:peroxin-11B